MVAPIFTAVLFPFQVENKKLEEGKNHQQQKKRKETKVSKLRKSVLIAYKCLHLKNYPTDVVVLFFFDSLSVIYIF